MGGGSARATDRMIDQPVDEDDERTQTQRDASRLRLDLAAAQLEDVGGAVVGGAVRGWPRRPLVASSRPSRRARAAGVSRQS